MLATPSQVSTRLVRALTIAGLLALAASAPAQVAQSIRPHVARFFESQADADHAHPSFATLEPLVPHGPAPADFPVSVTFTQRDGKHTASIAIDDGTSLYGTGMVAGRLLRNGTVKTLWNTDAYGYQMDSPSIYQSMPWVLAVREDGTAFGAWADTTYRVTVDLTNDISFIADGPSFGVVVIDGPSPQHVITTLTDLTGRITLPPKWALGYHQCRYSYNPDTRVKEIAAGFRDRDIPCDVIWMDIDYMDGYRCFTFDPQQFSDPAGLNAHLHAMGFHTTWMIDPGIKAEPGYFVYDQGTKRDAWVKNAKGENFVGEVWPGPCVFPDFTSVKVRQWWGTLYKDFMALGIDGVWNDMNEPAVFNVQSKTMPLNNIHHADADLGGTDTHDRYHNVYGMLMVKATRDGVMKANPDKRPFVLSRANYLGGHRYAAGWTGDNSASWEHIDASIPMVLNMGLSGQPFAGPDIGGFAGNGNGEMFARWMGFGAFFPFCRGHTGKGNINKEPWAFGEEVEDVCRIALNARYRLMPYLYTLFWEASQDGLPVARPLFFADPKDPALRSEENAFLLGGDILIAPQLGPTNDRVSALPDHGSWPKLRLWDSDAPQLPDVRIRPGAIVPAGPSMEYVDQKPLDTLTLYVALDAHGQAEGTLYEDAGEGWGFQHGEYRLTHFVARVEGGSVKVGVTGQEGDWPEAKRKIEVVVVK